MHFIAPLTVMVLAATVVTARADPEPAKAPATTPVASKFDLFPATTLHKIADGRGSQFASSAQSLEQPNAQAFSFDTGDGWKGDALMAGTMAGAFAALVALCSGGACMLK